jgi:hypothetical protein
MINTLFSFHAIDPMTLCPILTLVLIAKDVPAVKGLGTPCRE